MIATDAAIMPIPGSAVAQMVALTEVAALLLDIDIINSVKEPLT
jgi:hypothetical protein